MGRDAGEGWIAKEHQETLGSHGYVHQLVCRNGFMGVHVFKSHQIVRFKYVQFIEYQLCSIYVLKKHKLLLYPQNHTVK